MNHHSKLSVDLINTDPNDIFIVVPVKPFGLDNEPGTPFTVDFQAFLWKLAAMGYWPVDFGEANDTHVVLWLRYDPTATARQTQFFIDTAGDI